MLSSIFIGIALACLSVHADVEPSYPAGDIQTTGKTCHIAWKGDQDSTTIWKDMSIELMTGDSSRMVTPNAAIYFYQFRSPHTSTYEWTTRFAIISSSGEITVPPHSTHPDGESIPWGVGGLVPSSIVVPPPTFTTTMRTTTTTATPRKPSMSNAVRRNGVIGGCKKFITEISLFCDQIPEKYNITVEDFEAWNGGPCNAFQQDSTPLVYCVEGPTTITTHPTTDDDGGVPPPTFTTMRTTTTTSATPRKPSNAAHSNGVIGGCRKFITETSLFCNQIPETYNITVEDFEAWNGGSCDTFQQDFTPLVYCVEGPTAITAHLMVTPTASIATTTMSSSLPVFTPMNVASGVVSGCTKFFMRTTELCSAIEAKYDISVAQFESWNGGAGVCDFLESGKAYCRGVAGH
ncbi:hypothetical protein C0995_009088 [Termitomyces sp. Mi166|nr:hypothetical protein C0995_009088 [Termitomyces sp. Mi166\